MKTVRDKLEPLFKTYHRNALPDANLIRAAVLMVIFEKRGEPYVLLTKRTNDVEHHKGQVSFPGGATDPGDRDTVATALRETEEEIGLDPERIEILGLCDDIAIPTGFVVTPVVGYIADLPELKLNAAEVESILEVPLSFFADAKNKKVVKMMRGGEFRDVYFFSYGETQIWGATAAIIDSFLQKFQLAASHRVGDS